MIFEDEAGKHEFKQKAQDRWRMISSYIDSISKDDFDQVRLVAIFRWRKLTPDTKAGKANPSQNPQKEWRKKMMLSVLLKKEKLICAESLNLSLIKSNRYFSLL